MNRLRIVIDTREQRPWHFPEECAEVVRGTLKTGDYALENDPLYAIERKSLDDFVGTLSSGWPRFCRELKRMADMDAQTIIVEGSMMEILSHSYNHPVVTPGFVMKRIAELAVRNVSVLLCEDADIAAGMCYSILRLRKVIIDGKDPSTDSKSDVSERK